MLRLILIYGLVAGAIVSVQLFLIAVVVRNVPGGVGMFVGYTTMIVAFSLIFVAVKAHRDRALGGVIKFLPALGMGLAISAVATLVYVLTWEASLPLLQGDVMDTMINSEAARMRAKGASQAEIDAFIASMASMREAYRNPLIRMGYTALEIFPVGLLISIAAAGLLRNPRFMPARRLAGS